MAFTNNNPIASSLADPEPSAITNLSCFSSSSSSLSFLAASNTVAEALALVSPAPFLTARFQADVAAAVPGYFLANSTICSANLICGRVDSSSFLSFGFVAASNWVCHSATLVSKSAVKSLKAELDSLAIRSASASAAFLESASPFDSSSELLPSVASERLESVKSPESEEQADRKRDTKQRTAILRMENSLLEYSRFIILANYNI